MTSNKKFPGTVGEEMKKGVEDGEDIGGKNNKHALTYAATVSNSLRKNENRSKKPTGGSPVKKATRKAFAKSKEKTETKVSLEA